MTEPGKSPVNPGISKVLIPVAVALIGVAGVLFATRHLENQHEAEAIAHGATIPKVGEVLPDFELQTLSGQKVRFSSVHGKVTLVNFWATWCGPCLKEMPSIQKLRTQYRGRGFEVLGVNVDEDPEKVLAAYTQKLKIEFPSYVDPKGELSDRFGISGIPYSLLIGEGLRVLAVELGDRDWYSAGSKKEVEKWLGI